MIPPANSNVPDSIEAHDFEQLLQDGIQAVKNGNRVLGKRLLDQAALINAGDVRIWIWLSATTDDMDERRSYLEHAVVLDPSNAIAKRGLALISDKRVQSKPVAESAPTIPPAAPPPKEVSVKTYLCPNCGAKISYSIGETMLVCQFCGFTRKIDEQVVAESKDQLLDEALPTERAHRWAEAQEKVTCEQCGVVMILPAGQTADSCPYCGSNRFIPPSSPVEMIDPQMIGLFKVDPQNAGGAIKDWLGKGWLSPDNLVTEHGGMQLHPAYYPFWLFEGTLEVPWFCDVNVGSTRLPQWEAHSGSQFENFKDVLISGLKKIVPSELAGIEPFNLQDLVDFSADYLAGWVALSYDLPLADASLKARERVMKKVQGSVASLVEPSHPKRNFSTGAGKWSGLTYKLALLPIYTGNYVFQGKHYRLLINGQTGKVSGSKPRDNIKLGMMVVIGLIILSVILAVLLLLLRAITG